MEKLDYNEEHCKSKNFIFKLIDTRNNKFGIDKSSYFLKILLMGD